MDLYEHQGKDLFAEHGIPLADREVATTPEEAAEAAARLGGHVAVKVQVQMGGRGKGGGVALVHSPEEAANEARRMLEEGFKGTRVTRVLVERLVDIAAQYYAAISLDRGAGTYLAMVSNEGGVDIEAVAQQHPRAIRRLHVDAVLGLRDYQVRRLVGHLPARGPQGLGRPARQDVRGAHRRRRDAGRGEPVRAAHRRHGDGARREGDRRRQRVVSSVRASRR